MSVVLSLGMAACDTGSLLEVRYPGQVSDSDLNDPTLAATLTASVVADTECAWASYVGYAAFQADEYIYAGTGGDSRKWGLRDVDEAFGAYANAVCPGGFYAPLHIARVQADLDFDRIQKFTDAAVPTKAKLLATLRAYQGYTLIAFGEGFCGTTLGESTIFTPTQLLEKAEAAFSEALTLSSGQSGIDNIINMARVGRARARVGLQKFPDAIADAASVPAGFRLNAARDQALPRNENTIFARFNGPPGSDFGRRTGAISAPYRNVTWKGVKDPRVQVTWDGTTTASDGFTPHWKVVNKGISYTEGQRMASYEEAQLIIAEAAAMTNDLPRATAIMNTLHTKAGIPAITAADVPTQAAVIRQVIEERRREFFIEGGQRLRDHLRWRGTPYNVPFKGETGSLVDPTGIDQTGQRYGTGTCFPVPLTDR